MGLTLGLEMNRSENEKSEIRFSDLASIFGFEGEFSTPNSNTEFSDSKVSKVVESILSGELVVWHDDDEKSFLSQMGVEMDSLAVNGLVDSNSTNVDEDSEHLVNLHTIVR